MKTPNQTPSKAQLKAEQAKREAEMRAREAEIEYAQAKADAEAEAATEAERQRNMAKTLKKYKETYTDSVSSSGAKSLNNGDGIAKALAAKAPTEVADLADKVMQTEPKHHVTKYLHLNQGQIRMNSGNRIRAAYKKAISEGNKDEANRIREILGMEAIA